MLAVGNLFLVFLQDLLVRDRFQFFLEQLFKVGLKVLKGDLGSNVEARLGKIRIRISILARLKNRLQIHIFWRLGHLVEIILSLDGVNFGHGLLIEADVVFPRLTGRSGSQTGGRHFLHSQRE